MVGFNGKITKIKIYDYALSQDEVNMLYMRSGPSGMGFVDWFGIIGWGFLLTMAIIGCLMSGC